MFGKKKAEPKYSTRVAENTLAPVWKEAFVFINEAFADPKKERKLLRAFWAAVSGKKKLARLANR